jgi:hypothetical protein
MLPDLAGIFSLPDAGPTPPATSGDGGIGKPGAKDGPCKDLMLFCLEAIDMFLFNPDCFTCSGGKGCQACNIPYAI